MHLIGVQFFVFSQVIPRKALFFVEFINIGEEKWNRRQKKASLKRGWQHKISILSTCRRGSKSHSEGLATPI
ncbi:hypothetical protein D3N24_01505 [Vibrio vulnificus]|uniref:Uncharacterized protein n=1 Tax=Vibrio vulnificus TaxID=672 RepID=A0A2S3QY80_VIBVL|nr:hypothetical protein [Vibrio vulnificus]EGQ9235852.1 hypothetical protein [Vibrio vulnificus]EGQ9328845.1 hypothetical protein [Vibrio vulnificus]EGQ9782998.1 hypothetical protein [Vibrio vulnificus]EGQ9830920.1 hypothetical protein [Vibrio vulnificus]